MHTASDNRYSSMLYQRCGRSGLLLPAISLGLWHNFGNVDDPANMKRTIVRSFDLGITHFDLANNYGPPGGEAEKNFGKILRDELFAYRDEMVISTKAGYYMWPGPYGEWGSRKYLLNSLEQSLKRMGLDYVDIFYHHRPDKRTPIEETMQALDFAVRSGKALYAGISNYNAEQTEKAVAVLKQLGTPCLIHQPRYNMLDRWVEKKNEAINKNLLEVLEDSGVGCIVFSPLAQGRLSDKYLKGIPPGSRIGRNLPNGAILEKDIDEVILKKMESLNEMAKQRNQSLAQMAIAWLLKDPRITSVLIGASSAEQVENCVGALGNISFGKDELEKIDKILAP
jgi:L-glyceraldehyde 3-phosphate reductase